MATPAQIAANRANAQKSTGPRTPEGKTASSMNALKHGMDAASIVIPGEDPADYERIASEYRRDLDPRSALEQFQVDTIIRCDWQRRRLRRIEAKLYRALLAEGETPEEIDVDILRDSPTGKLLRKTFAQIASLERAHSRALAELRRIRREREQSDLPGTHGLLEMPPELVDRIAAYRKEHFPRNEPDSAPQSAPEPPQSAPALRL
ncbi:MAG TPA: hypothetical protein VMS37_06040 [Verrucomicrobiae bacterium]|nr:hypothetical protein [Verrucomicrobiae bacterium]